MLFSNSLLERIQEVKQTFVLDLENLDVVKANLKFLHDACVASEQLLEDGAHEIVGWASHPFTDRLLQYYVSHLEEERDEILLLKGDLESAGVPSFPGLGLPDTIAMAMVGSQYYLIKHQHPVSLLGYMAVVEADPTPISVVERLEELYGKNMFRFIRLHAIKDLEHRKELIEVIDLAPKALHDFISFSTKNVLGYLEQAASQWQTTALH